MAKNLTIVRMRESLRTMFFWIQAAVLVTAGFMPFLVSGQASAAQLTSRSATIDKSKVSSTNVTFVFGYTASTSATQQGLTYQFCTTPLGTCTLPAGMSVQSATQVSQSGFQTNATAFAPHAASDQGACLMGSTTTMMCFGRTQAGAGAGALTHAIAGITAPSSKQTVYIRMIMYSDTAYATPTDSGTVAVAFVDQLLTNGRVQERLNFCVAAIDAAAALPANLAACSALGTNTIDIGTIDNSSIVTSPVATTATNGANNNYGILMLNTNASGGSVVSFFPEAAASGTNQLRDFRVTGATCNAANTTLTDQCFQDAGAAATTFTAGTEDFGLQVACIDTTQGTTVNALGAVPAAYSNTDNDTSSVSGCQYIVGGGGTPDAGVKFAWNNTATAATLASSTGVVDNEIVKVRFGATASSTTPTGAYSVTTNYIATPTF